MSEKFLAVSGLVIPDILVPPQSSASGPLLSYELRWIPCQFC